MSSFIDDIWRLHKKFDFPQPAGYKMLDPDLLEMRLNFILEELQELAEASSAGMYYNPSPDSKNNRHFVMIKDPTGTHDPAGVLDALVDIVVVVLGTAHLMGLLNDSIDGTPIFEEAWIRVMVANMGKVRGRGKRGHGLDLIKPPGWRAPYLDDLVQGEE